MNNTAGLFGGLLLGVALLATVAYINVGQTGLENAWNALFPGSGGSSGSAGADTPAQGSASYGTYNSLPAAASSTSPYQLVVNPSNGVQISTAAALPEELQALIPTPQIAPLSPTSAGLVLA